jgi:hypothetical protein
LGFRFAGPRGDRRRDSLESGFSRATELKAGSRRYVEGTSWTDNIYIIPNAHLAVARGEVPELLD